MMNRWLGKKKRKEEKEREAALMRNGAMLLEESMALFNGPRNPIRSFSIEELKEATDNYHSRHRFFEDRCYVLYEGRFEGFPVCIKKLDENFTYMGVTDVIKDIVVSSQASMHKNVVKLFGCCLETNLPTLVLEYAGNTTLGDRLRRNYGIAGDDGHNVAKLTDFSDCIAIPKGASHAFDAVRGTLGFLAPEYLTTGYLNQKSDVYSFGVLMLELLTGQSAYQFFSNFYSCLIPPEFSWEDCVKYVMENDRIKEIVDPAILEGAGWPAIERQLRDYTSLLHSCLSCEEEARPDMIGVAKQLRVLEHSTP